MGNEHAVAHLLELLFVGAGMLALIGCAAFGCDPSSGELTHRRGVVAAPPATTRPEPPPSSRAHDAGVGSPLVACRANAVPCEEEHSSFDGRTNYTIAFERREDGQVVLELMTERGAANPFKEVRTTYDLHGRPVRVDTRAAGRLTFREVYRYRGAEREPSVEQYDTNGDGRLDKSMRHRYVRDAEGRVLVDELDDSGDRRFDLRRETPRDAAGRIASVLEIAIGAPPRRPLEYARDEHGHVLGETHYALDGTPDPWTHRLTHDACGNLVRLEEDWHDDGRVDFTITYRYDCARRPPIELDMLPIPPATLLMGCQRSRDPSCSETEQPAHSVRVPGFRIGRTEVTQEQYAACVAAHACPRPARDFAPGSRRRAPVVSVSWDEARGFCHWLALRLATEAEWELAARGTDGRIYPWGDDRPSCERAHTSACGALPADVGGRLAGASPFGALDMAGNVDEWVEDAYAAYGQARTSHSSGERVARGGAYDAWHSRSTARNALAHDYRDALLGFRCASSDPR